MRWRISAWSLSLIHISSTNNICFIVYDSCLLYLSIYIFFYRVFVPFRILGSVLGPIDEFRTVSYTHLLRLISPSGMAIKKVMNKTAKSAYHFVASGHSRNVIATAHIDVYKRQVRRQTAAFRGPATAYAVPARCAGRPLRS